MAYGLYLYKEIESKSGKTIRLEIFQKDYSGSSIEIESMSGVPLTLVSDNANSGVYLPIVKSFLNINIIDTEQIDYSVFFTPDATKFKVLLKVSGTLEWSGYLTPDSFSQSLQYKSEINLVARDNLGMLSEFDFDMTNTFYSISTLINTALTRIGFQFTLETRTTKVDSANETIVNGLTQSKFWVGKNWQEVLETILTGIGCQLRYVGGNKYAIFDIGNLSSLGTTEIAQPFVFIEQSGIQEIVPAWKVITINQDYGKGDNSYDGFIEEASFEFDSNKGGDENNPYNFYTRPYYTISLSNDWVSTIPMLSPYEYPNLDPNDIYITGKSPATTLFMGQDLTYGKYFEAINDGKAIQFKFKASNYPYYITRRRSGEYMVEPMLRARYLYEMKVRCNLFAETATDKYVLQGRNWIIWTNEYSDALEFTLPQTKESGVFGKKGTELTSQMDSPQEQDIVIEAYGLGVNARVYIEFYPYTATYTEVDGLGNVDDYPAIVYDVHTMKLSSFEVRIVENEFGGLETKATLNADHNINGGIELALGQVPRGLGGYNTYLGGIFKNSNPYYPPMYDFHFTGGVNYTLSELVGREIAHHYKTQRKKLSGNIINSENFASMPSFAKPFTDGTLTYALNYGSLDFRNEVMSVELIEVEDYTTEDYTFIEATIDTGGTSLGSGETEFIQWSAAGNAKRIYELDTASDTDKAGAYIVVDKLGLSAAKKVALSSKIDSTQNVLLKEPTGFKSPESVIVTYNSTNRTITLTGTIEGYSNGVLISELVSGWVSSPHPATLDSIYYLYYNGSSIVWSDSFPDFQYLFIAVVHYRTNNPFAQRECHGLMQWQSHLSSHNNIGTYRLSGGDVSNVVIGSTTADNRRPIISECIISDEDLATTNAALTSKKYSIRYLSGANTINYTLQANDIVPLLGNNPYYNSFTTPNYGQTLMPDNSAMTIWLFEVPTTADSASQEIRHAFVQGQSVTLAANASPAALATAVSTESLKSPIDLYLGENSVISSEYVCIHKFVITYSGGNWVIASSIKVTGSRQSQVGSPSGSYLTAVSTDDTIDGNGSPAFPLSVSAYAAKKAGDILQDFSAKKLTTATLLLPQSAPTLASGEAAIYALDSGFSGETPSGAGTLTSVALTMPTGFSVSGSPITESGTFGVTFASGYRMFTETEIGNKIESSLIGAANGITPLDSGGKVALQYLPSTLLKYMGVWNASTNTPTLTSPDTNRKGQVWNVSVAGTQFGLDFKLGDWLIYNDSGVAEKSDNSDDVVSVNGYTGAVTLKTSDIAEQTNLYYTDARVKAYSDLNYLGISAKAADSDKLDGQDSTYFATAAQLNAANLTSGYLPYWNGSSFINSALHQNGTNIGIGYTDRSEKFAVNGSGYFNSSLLVASDLISTGDMWVKAGGGETGNLHFGASLLARLSWNGTNFNINQPISFSSSVDVTGTLFTSGIIRPTNTNTRRAGLYGVYDYTRVGHIWSIGDLFQIPNDGSGFGNLYGLAYKYGDYGGVSSRIGENHMLALVENGSVLMELGLNGNFWNNGYLKSNSYIESASYIKAATSIKIGANWEAIPNGTSGALDFNNSGAKASLSTTGVLTIYENINTNLRIPKVAPTSATTDEFYLYSLDSGFSGETPSGAGSVTSISMVVPTGLSVTPETITESGTFTISYASGYQMMTATESSKLAGIEANANNYSLPTATGSVLGGVKIGTNVTITDGVISVHNPVTLGTANGLSLSTQELSLGLASTSTNGALSSTDWNTFNGKQAKLIGTGTSSLVRVNTLGTIAYDDSTYLTGNQTITLSGIVTGSGTTAITTAIADNALSIAKTNGLQSALDGKLSTTGKAADSDKLDGHDTSYFATATGGTGYIQNQIAAEQTANIWIDGKIKLSRSGLPSYYGEITYQSAGLQLSGIEGYFSFGKGTIASYTPYFSIVDGGAATFASTVAMTENINTNLRIPKVAPTSPTSGEYYFYIVE